MEEEKNKKKMILAIIGAIILVAGIVGLTIAYFRAQAESKDIVVSSKKLSIVFSDPEGSLIRASDIEPIADEDIDTLGTKKTFTIAKKDDNDKDVYLRLELTDLEVSDNFKDSDLRWALYKSGSIVTEGSFVNVKDNTSLPLANNILLDSTTPEEYNLYIWIHETGVDQERLMGGSLSGKITVTGTENIQEGIVNEGKLADGMIPVVYDETNNVWVKAGGDLGWYDYSKQEWANMILTKADSHECEIWNGIKGDINKDGDISMEDRELLMQYLGNTDEEWLQRGDLNNDGTINVSDFNPLMYYINGVTPLCEEAITSKSRIEYLEASPGTSIEKSDISDFYVWVPRYKYKINNTGSTALPSMIDVEFESGITSTGVSINTNGVAKTEYYTHPSFRDGSKVYKTTAYDQSGWDKELTGFWVAKFQVSNSYEYAPNQNILAYNKNNTISRLYNGDLIAKEDTSSFLNSTVETHSMKNTEWGAIAYLSQSKYGKMGNNDFTGANKEIFVNSSDALITGRSAGGVFGGNIMGTSNTISTLDKEVYSYDGFSCSSQFIRVCKGTKDVLKGTGASTSGTVYGVYDMVGGRVEYVMANYNNSLASSGFTIDFFTTESNKKYYDSYTEDKTYILGDATYETNGWYNDKIGTLNTDNPFLMRGGVILIDEGAEVGIFNYDAMDGSAEYEATTRLVFIP